MTASRRAARLGAAVAMAAMLAANAAAATPRSVLVMAKSLDDLITLDPAEVFEFSGAEIVANLYQRLFRPNPDNPAEPLGDVVESWRASADGLTFAFEVRDGLVFASGRAIDAQDAVFSLRRAVALNKAPSFILTQFGLDAGNVAERVRALDEDRFEVVLDKAYAPSLVLNALSAGIASVVDREAALANAVGDDLGHGWLRSHAAGSGAFVLRRWQPGEYLLLDANPAYAEGAPHLKRVAIRDIRESATQRLLLERGDVDMARNLGPDQLAALAGADGVRLEVVPRARLFYLALNQSHAPLDRPAVRRALRYLVDYRGIAERLLGPAARVHQAFLPHGFLGALDDTPFAYDPARARALLAEAGLEAGFDLRLDVRSDATALRLAQAIQATMAEGGVRIEIAPGSAKQVLTRYRARRHELFMGQWGPDYLDPHTNASTFARNPDNSDDAPERTLAWRNGWNIPELTARTDAAVLERDADRRAELYRGLQREVQADSPFVILFQENEVIALRDDVKGFRAGLTADQTSYHGLHK
jgi:peptide/nickel transport system substrate-binding protein